MICCLCVNICHGRMNTLMWTTLSPKGDIMAEYNVTITNGSGSQAMNPGEYEVSTTYAPGYESTTLSPTTYTATSPSGSGSFTIEAYGTLTIIFNETGAEGGTPISSGSVVMTDPTGNTQYGSVVTIDSNGTAIFDKVPYGSAQTPYTLHFKQLTSDSDHDIYPNVFTVGMGDQTQTEYIQNNLKVATQDFSLTDANYSGLPVENAVLNFEPEDNDD